MNLFSENKIATAKAFVSTAAQVAATAMVVRSMCRDLMPYEFQDYIFSGIRTFFSRFSSQLTMVIEEFDGFVNNQIYEAAEIYLGTIVSPDANRLNVKKADKENKIVVGVEQNQEIVDRFEGVEFKWILVSRQVESRHFHNPHDLNATIRSEIRSFSLSFHKKHKEKVLNSYLPYILRTSKSKKQETKALKIHTINNDGMYGSLSDAWRSVNLDHPANFDTIAMDSDLKKAILDDLERFVKRKDYYRKVGKAWKRGYLLYGPPGTGKSSLIAAMANYLKFDIYDLELTELRCNSDLRRLLVATANRSILVVEDIDCTIELQDRLAEARALHPRGYHQESQQVTLSGVLNFIDGLWSSCGDERIIVFTTNHKHKLDPALLRPGRMDFHIHMSYCTPCGFKLLAQNYLKITNHDQFAARFKTIEDLLRVIKVTPAEVAEQLLKSDEPDVALEGLVEFMLKKQKENEEAGAKAKEEQENMDNKKKEESGQEEVEGMKENGAVILRGNRKRATIFK